MCRGWHSYAGDSMWTREPSPESPHHAALRYGAPGRPPSRAASRCGSEDCPSPWPGSRPNSVFYSHHEGQLEPKCPQGKRRASRSWVSPGFHTENEEVHVSILKKGTVTGRPRQRPPSPQSVLGTIARPHTCFCLVHRALIFFFFYNELTSKSLQT